MLSHGRGSCSNIRAQLKRHVFRINRKSAGTAPTARMRIESVKPEIWNGMLGYYRFTIVFFIFNVGAMHFINYCIV